MHRHAHAYGAQSTMSPAGLRNCYFRCGLEHQTYMETVDTQYTGDTQRLQCLSDSIETWAQTVTAVKKVSGVVRSTHQTMVISVACLSTREANRRHSEVDFLSI